MIKHKNMLLLVKLILLFFCALVISPTDLSSHDDSKVKPTWFLYAKEYVEANEKIQASVGKDDTISEYFLNANEAVRKFMESPQPSINEINRYLKSDKYIEKKVGIAAMSLQPIDNPIVAKELVRFLGSEDRNFRIYASVAIKRMNPESYAMYEDQMYQYTLDEKDIAVLTSEIIILGILNNPRYLPLFINFLQGDCMTLKLTAYNAIKIMGEDYINQVINILKEKNDSETINFITELESGVHKPLKYHRYERKGEEGG